MLNILVLIDHFTYRKQICCLLIQLSQKIPLKLTLLHAVKKQQVIAQPDLSGSIGLGEKAAILKNLSENDYLLNKTENRQGWILLEETKYYLNEGAMTDIKLLLHMNCYPKP